MKARNRTLTINQRDKSFYCLCNNDAEICRVLITLSKCVPICYLRGSLQQPHKMAQGWHFLLEVLKVDQKHTAGYDLSAYSSPQCLPLTWDACSIVLEKEKQLVC